ncbi:MAG: helix-turn-helix domain-containing protein [Proteobacteria bacterium]|nr:helix-turn-helix domain-containing protein [Pseudomonadota bacterium]
MSESMATQGGEHLPQDGAVPVSGVTAGVLLKQVRESAGVHIDALAGALKVPVAKLQALEADQPEAFPDAVFMRALASSVCRVLKADAAPVLALLPQGAPAHLPPDKSINASFKDPVRRGGGKGGSLEPPRSRLVGIAVVTLLAAALAMAYLPFGADDKSEAADPAVEQAKPAAPPRDAQEPVNAAGAQHSLTMAQELPAPAAQAEPAAAAAAAAQAPESDGALVIRAKAQTWVQVRNGAGRVVLQKALEAGESFSAEGSPPWHVVIGRADAADVVVRGEPMDLKAVARNNVARFEVK